MTPLDPPVRTIDDFRAEAVRAPLEIRRLLEQSADDLPRDRWPLPLNQGCKPRRGTGGNRGGRPPVPVQCVETGRVFPSFKAAGDWVCPGAGPVISGNISTAATSGRAAYGYHWRRTPKGGVA